MVNAHRKILFHKKTSIVRQWQWDWLYILIFNIAKVNFRSYLWKCFINMCLNIVLLIFKKNVMFICVGKKQI